MNGDKLVNSFVPTPEPDSLTAVALHAEASNEVETFLRQLYPEWDVLFLGSIGMAGAVKSAQMTLEEESDVRWTISQSRKNIIDNTHRAGKHLDYDRPVRAAVNKNLQPTAKQITEGVANTKLVAMYGATTFSGTLLAKSILGVEATGGASQEKVGEVISNSIKTMRMNLANTLDSVAGTLTVIRPYVGSATMHITANMVRPQRLYTPDWIKAVDTWTDDVHRLASLLQELDAFVALLEWVSIKKLPYVPIIAPMAIETGQQIDGPDNRHADLLLCSLAGNEIIPIQAKTRVTHYTRYKYDDGVAFVSVNDLGMESFSSGPARDNNGHVRTSNIKTATYGAIMSQWSNTYRKGKDKKEQPALHKMLQPAFEHFDTVVSTYMKSA